MTTMKLFGMKLLGTTIIAGFALVAVSALAAETFDSRALVLENVTGTVHIRTTNGSKITVDIDDGDNIIAAPKVSMRKGEVLVRGKKVRHANCSSRNGKVRLSVGKSILGGRKYPLEDFPTITVSVPVGASLEITGGRVFGEAGDLGEADIQANGCGRFTIGNVRGDLDAQVNGSGDFIAGTVDGKLDAQVNGSGDLLADNVGGDLDAQVNGSGDLTIGNVAGDAKAQINGSGDILTGAIASGFDAQINGSGDMDIASTNGAVDVGINGSGDITIKGGTASPFRARIIGSGDVAFQGHANGVSARVIGSGAITLASYEGKFRASKRGVHVRNE